MKQYLAIIVFQVLSASYGDVLNDLFDITDCSIYFKTLCFEVT